MDYLKHYNILISRAKNRLLDGYVEKHHVVPVCMGGNNAKENIVELTPEEHYLAHQLLVKINPDVYGLVWAAVQMTRHPNQKRTNNKIYGWLRRRHQQVAKNRVGDKNGSFGKPWYHNLETGEAKKFIEGCEPTGWARGRTLIKETTCEICQTPTGKKMARFCKAHRLERKRAHAATVSETYRSRRTEEDKEKFTYAITTSKTWKEAIEKAEFKSEGYSRTRLQRFAEEYNIKLMAD